MDLNPSYWHTVSVQGYRYIIMPWGLAWYWDTRMYRCYFNIPRPFINIFMSMLHISLHLYLYVYSISTWRHWQANSKQRPYIWVVDIEEWLVQYILPALSFIPPECTFKYSLWEVSNISIKRSGLQITFRAVSNHPDHNLPKVSPTELNHSWR